MPDPILPDHWRAQVIFQGKSGLPEDRYVNSFVFRNDGDISTSPVDQRIAQVLTDFYFKEAPASVQALYYYLAGTAWSSWSIKCYDLGKPPPRNPVEPTVTPLPVHTGGTNAPFEVAACLSLRTNLRTPRGRGRIYLGPLSMRAISADASGIPKLASDFRAVAKETADRLRSGSGGYLTWTVLSQTDATARPVIGGYIDDAPDTQRRRGQEPVARTTFGTVL